MKSSGVATPLNDAPPESHSSISTTMTFSTVVFVMEIEKPKYLKVSSVNRAFCHALRTS